MYLVTVVGWVIVGYNVTLELCQYTSAMYPQVIAGVICYVRANEKVKGHSAFP